MSPSKKKTKKTPSQPPRSNAAEKSSSSNQKTARKSSGGPTGRLETNIRRIEKIYSLIQQRVSKYLESEPENELLSGLLQIAKRGQETEALSLVAQLQDKKWQPSRNSYMVRFQVGDSVDIVSAHRDRYLCLYEESVLNNLKIVQVFDEATSAPSAGKKRQMVAVQGGKGIAFFVPKSHVALKS